MASAPIDLSDIKVQPTTRELALAYVCQRYDVTPTEFVSPRKPGHLVEARKLFVWLIHTYQPSASYCELGRWMRRHHSSVINLYQGAKRLLQADADFAQECARFPMFVAGQREAANA